MALLVRLEAGEVVDALFLASQDLKWEKVSSMRVVEFVVFLFLGVLSFVCIFRQKVQSSLLFNTGNPSPPSMIL